MSDNTLKTDQDLLTERRSVIDEKRALDDREPIAAAILDYQVAEIDAELERRRSAAFFGPTFADGLTERERAWFKAPLAIAALIASALVACTPAIVAPAQLRPTANLRTRAAITVESTCAWGASSGAGTDVAVWAATSDDRAGAGVIVGPRHALTAAHVVACAAIPRVQVTTSDGRTFRAVVVKVDELRDVAELELASAGTFGIAAPTPLRGAEHVGYWACVVTTAGEKCGPIVDRAGELAWISVDGKRGESGAGVYDEGGRLVGTNTRVCVAGKCAIVAGIQ